MSKGGARIVPSLRGFKTHGLTLCLRFLLSWPCSPLSSPGSRSCCRQAWCATNLPAHPAPFVLRHLFIIALIWIAVSASCLAVIQMSGRMGSQSPASEHLNWQSVWDSLGVHLRLCCHSMAFVRDRDSWMPPKPPQVSCCGQPASTAITAHSPGEVTERVLCFLIPAHLPLLHSQIRCLPHPQFCCKPPPGWNSSSHFEQEQEQPWTFLKAMFSSNHVL